MTGADGIRVRTASAAEVLALAEPLLPHTVTVVADLRGTGPARRVRVHLAERDQLPLGAVVLSERCRGRWYASPLVLDPAAGAPLGRLIDKSPAWEVGGPSTHVMPVVPYLTRTERRAPIHEAFHCAELAPVAFPVDPRCRLARADDLESLVELYADYEHGRFPTRPRLREFLERQLHSRPVTVAEVDGVLGAATLCLYRTPGYDMWADLTVRPECRRQGLATAVGFAGISLSTEAGQRVCAVIAGSNPMTVEQATSVADDWHTDEDRWTQQPLQSPRRFPGHRRLRRVVEGLEGRLAKRPPLLPDSSESS